MECGKLTAKLRDAVPVCFMVDGKEIKRYKNIEIPDELRKLPFTDFKFDVPAVGAITFKIVFAADVLPDPMPEPRGLKSRKSVAEESADVPQAILATTADEVLPTPEERQPVDATGEAMETDDHKAITAEEPEIMEIAYHATGERRKELVKAISHFTALRPHTRMRRPSPSLLGTTQWTRPAR